MQNVPSQAELQGFSSRSDAVFGFVKVRQVSKAIVVSVVLDRLALAVCRFVMDLREFVHRVDDATTANRENKGKGRGT